MAYSLFETAELGPLISKNRTVRSATNEHLSDPSGQITPAWVDSLEGAGPGWSGHHHHGPPVGGPGPAGR